ncbi:MAG: Rrf2 family nitric oxide-sensitive transcriptional repressor [Bacteriovoracaceae bacterium]|jgi:Rrf2 family nitric oxide-sensitive transcriptional repressor
MYLTKKTDFSFRVLIYLKRTSERVKVSEVSSYFNISENHVQKISNDLHSLGLIDTFRGPSGGMLIKEETLELSIDELVKKLEVNLDIVECFSPGSTCTIDGQCRLKGVLKSAQNAFFDVLHDYKLKDL